MDQDQNGTKGEATADQFTATGTLGVTDTTGARVTAAQFAGASPNTFDAVTVTFSEAVNPATFTAADVLLTVPGRRPTSPP